MFSISAKPRLILPTGPRRDGPDRRPCPWDTLERLLQDLNACERGAGQIRLALEAVREAVDADAVFWCSATPREGPEVVGSSLPADWCHEFVRRMLAETPGVDGQLLRASLPATPPRLGPSPRSAAMVRLSRSQGSWIVALSLRPERRFSVTDMRVMSLARRMVVARRKYGEVCGRLKETVSSLVHCLTAVIEARAPHLRGHSERVAQIAARLAQQMRLPAEAISDTYFAGLLHDVGLIHLAEASFNTPGPLTDDEWAVVRECVTVGDRILSGVRPLERLRPGVRHIRERYDGTGYPDKLAGEDVPLMARVLSVAEAFDAMMFPRPYRPALHPRKVEAVLRDGAGRQWDPAVIEHFLDCKDELFALCAEGQGSSVGPAIDRAVGSWGTDSSPEIITPPTPTVTAAVAETVSTRNG